MVNCRLCQIGSVELHFDFGKQPIVHRLLEEPLQPYDSFPFRVGYCRLCGFLQIIDSIPPSEMYKNYFTVSSWKNQPHAERLIHLMQVVLDFNAKTRVLEIGCNDGVFLEKLGQSGFVDTLGIEPTLDAYELAVSRGVNVINGFFGREMAESVLGGFRPNLIVARQVIEHIPDLHDFLGGAYAILPRGGGLVLELPDHSMNYENLDYSFWEEHCNYFTFNTLRTLLAMHGFDIVHHESTLFSGKALLVFAQKEKDNERTTTPRNFDHEKALRYKDAYPVFRQLMRDFLEVNAESGVAVYGAGARSCNFINLLGLNDCVDVFIDDQIEKQNKYVPLSECLIRPYRDEDADLFFLLGVNCENESKLIKKRRLSKYISILPPSRFIPDFWRAMSQTAC